MQEPLKRAALGSLSLSCRVEEAPAQDSMNTAGPARARGRGTQEPLKRAAPGSLALSYRVEEAPAQDSMNTAGPASSCSAGRLCLLGPFTRAPHRDKASPPWPSLITPRALRARAGLGLSVGSFTNQHPCPQSREAEKTLRPHMGFPGQKPFSPDRWERSAGLGCWRWPCVPGPGL